MVTSAAGDAIYPYATNAGQRYRFAFRRSDGTLSSRLGVEQDRVWTLPNCVRPWRVSLCALLRFHATSDRNLLAPKIASHITLR